MNRQLVRLFTLLGLALWVGSTWADQLVGRVVGIADGDTITVLTAQRQRDRVRLTGIDAPEKRQAFGQVAKQHLSDLAYGNTVSVVFHKRDRYQRILGQVLMNGADAGLDQTQSGLAWHYKKYEREQSTEDRVAYARAEERLGESGAVSGAIPGRCRRGSSAGTERCAASAITTARFNRIEGTLATTFPEVRPAITSPRMWDRGTLRCPAPSPACRATGVRRGAPPCTASACEG